MSSPTQVKTSAPEEGTGPALAGLLSLANGDSVLAALSVGAERTVAVGEAAQPFAIAAVARHGSGQPIVVAVPSGAIAERLAHEIGVWLGPGEVAVFPAWETLPFERVSPGVRDHGPAARAHVAPAPAARRGQLMPASRRSSSLPSGRCSSGSGPMSRTPSPCRSCRGAQVDLDELVEQLARSRLPPGVPGRAPR